MSQMTFYGVFVLDRGEWRQISEHWQLSVAEERAREAQEVMGVAVRIRSNAGVLLVEYPSKEPRESLHGRHPAGLLAPGSRVRSSR